MLDPVLERLAIMGLYTETDSRRSINAGRACAAKRSTVIALGFVCVSTWSGAARADATPKSYPPCTSEPSVSSVDAAKGAFQAGRIAFEEGDYDRSILYWEDAFRRDCTAAKLLLNIARAYELNGNLESAVFALQTYLQREPETEERTTVEKRIEKLKARIEEKKPQINQEPGPQSVQAASPPPTQSNSSTPARNARPIWPVVVTGSGALGIAVGTTFAILGQKAVSAEKNRIAEEVVQTDQNGNPVLDESGEPYRCTRQGRKWDCPSDQLTANVGKAIDESKELKRAKTERAVGIILASGGAAVTAVGAYFWYTLWNPAPATALFPVPRSLATLQPALLPVIEADYRGIALLGRF